MPIRPENRRLYPRDWQRISERIRFSRAGGMCEGTRADGTRCCAPHKVYVIRAADDPTRWRLATLQEMERGDAVRIVLTTAHLDHDPTNNDDANLAALCQHCHLTHDRPHHLRSRRRNRDRHSGQRSLFELTGFA